MGLERMKGILKKDEKKVLVKRRGTGNGAYICRTGIGIGEKKRN